MGKLKAKYAKNFESLNETERILCRNEWTMAVMKEGLETASKMQDNPF